MTGLMMKDALVMRKTLRLYALFLLFYWPCWAFSPCPWPWLWWR